MYDDIQTQMQREAKGKKDFFKTPEGCRRKTKKVTCCYNWSEHLCSVSPCSVQRAILS